MNTFGNSSAKMNAVPDLAPQQSPQETLAELEFIFSLCQPRRKRKRAKIRQRIDWAGHKKTLFHQQGKLESRVLPAVSDSNATTVLTNQRFVGPEAKLIIVNVPFRKLTEILIS